MTLGQLSLMSAAAMRHQAGAGLLALHTTVVAVAAGMSGNTRGVERMEETLTDTMYGD